MRVWHHIFIVTLVLSSFSFSVSATTPTVDLIYPDSQQIAHHIDLSGTIKAKQDAQLAALEQGVVGQILVEAGDRVKKDQALVKLDSTLAKAKLDQAKAAFNSAVISFEEAVRLYQEVITLSKQQVVAKTLLAERKAQQAVAQAAKAKAKAELAEQQEVLARHTLRAPFDGVITHRHIDLGEWVTGQSAVFSLVSDKSLRLELAVPQEYLAYFTNNNSINVKVTPDVRHLEQFEASVTQIVGATNEISRTFSIFVDINDIKGIAPGISAQASLAFASDGSYKVWLPKTALKYHPDGGYSVFSVGNNKAKRHIVNLVETANDRVAISGVPKNTAIVISGVELLQNGQAVSVASIKGSDQ